MLEKPDLADEQIIACLRDRYSLPITAVEFLPIGYDPNAGVYRVTSDEGTDYFLKAKKDGVSESSLAVPRFLQDHGIRQVVAPLPTTDQQLSAPLEPFVLILYPFVAGRTAMEVGLSSAQALELGVALHTMHALTLPPTLTAHMRRETFIPKTLGYIRAVDTRVATASQFDNSIQTAMASFWHTNRALIFAIMERAQALGRTLQARSLPFVLCHADIHTANILVASSGSWSIVDWDEALLAPIERDLLFITGTGGGVTYTAEAQAAFFRGYGSQEVNSDALAYYRCDWVVEDVGEFAADIFLKQDVGDETRTDSARILRSMFDPGNTVEAAAQYL